MMMQNYDLSSPKSIEFGDLGTEMKFLSDQSEITIIFKVRKVSEDKQTAELEEIYEHSNEDSEFCMDFEEMLKFENKPFKGDENFDVLDLQKQK